MANKIPIIGGITAAAAGVIFVIFFTPSCRLFIPLAFVSYPNELFSYLVERRETTVVKLCSPNMLGVDSCVF